MPTANARARQRTLTPLMLLQPTAAKADQYDLLIYGDISAFENLWSEDPPVVTDTSIVEQLAALSPDAIKQINVRINSFGGNAFVGMRIYNALAAIQIRKVAIVEGVCMSAASLIAMACDEIQMYPVSIMLIHGPSADYIYGTASDLRSAADSLDAIIDAVASAYMKKTGQSKELILALLSDQQDHVYSGEQAVAAGFADTLIDPTAVPALAGEIEEDDDAPPQMRGLKRYLSHLPAPVAQQAMRAAMHAKPSRVPSTATTATTATSGVTTMPTAQNPAATAAPAAGAASNDELQVQMHANLRARNDDIRTSLEPSMHVAGVRELYESALLDPQMSVDTVKTKALVLLGAQAQPAGGGGVRAEAGADQVEKTREQAVQYLMARAGQLRGDDDRKARQGNPFMGRSLVGIAEHCLMASGRNIGGMNRDQIISMAINSSTSDFSNILENTMHKLLINAYNQTEQTWRRFCRPGTLSDFRPHNRYYMGSFSDLKGLNENGEYENGTLGDAEKEQITGKTKGRILNLSREILINDDMGVFTDMAVKLGQAAARTIEKDVYAMFALNSGAGPTMVDGHPMFHSAHFNIASVGGAPSMATVDSSRILMAQQLDPSGNDYLSIRPSIWLGPLALGSTAKLVNDARFDPDSSGKFERPNTVRGLFTDVVDTPRLSGTPWYMFADPSIEPVFEVGFLDGIQAPQLVVEDSFKSNGRAWRVALDYGTAGIGFRGAVQNPGA